MLIFYLFYTFIILSSYEIDVFVLPINMLSIENKGISPYIP